MSTLDMTPSTTGLNQRDMGARNTELLGQRGLCHLAPSHPDSTNVIGTQPRVPVALTLGIRGGHHQKTERVGVIHILSTGNLLKVTQPIVGFAAVDMVGLFPWCEGAKESSEYHSMNRASSLSAILTERNLKIPLMSLNRFKNPSRKTYGAATWGTATDVAKTRYLVPAFVADNGTPFFGGLLCARLRAHRKVVPFGVAQADGPYHRACTYYTTAGQV